MESKDGLVGGQEGRMSDWKKAKTMKSIEQRKRRVVVVVVVVEWCV